MRVTFKLCSKRILLPYLAEFQGVDFKSIDKKLAMLFFIDIGMLNANTSVP